MNCNSNVNFSHLFIYKYITTNLEHRIQNTPTYLYNIIHTAVALVVARINCRQRKYGNHASSSIYTLCKLMNYIFQPFFIYILRFTSKLYT